MKKHSDLVNERKKYSPLKSMPKNALTVGEDAPKFDDFLNSVFANKKHRSYQMRERSDKIGNIIEERFFKAANNREKDAAFRI